VLKGANWAAIRDNLSSGVLQATHMLIGMPIASTIGLAGSPKKPMVVPWLLNRNGQAITLKSEWKGQIGSDPRALKPFVEKGRKTEEPLTLAMTFPAGTHAMWSGRNCNFPQPKYCKWFLSQYRRWGMIQGAADYEGITRQVMRPDIYSEAMKEIGYQHGGEDNAPETLFDGMTFDPKINLDTYAAAFPTNNLRA
jgi:hypothetical protein